jgi:D-alanyl-D-alanine carboxypeptidase
MIVEAATGNSLAQEMRQRVFEPLQLNQTYFAPDEQVPSTTARGYGRAADQTNISLSFAYATANLVSTAGDVRRFAEGLLNGELLTPEAQEQMFTFVSGKGQYNMPTLEYGLGIMRNTLAVGPAANGEKRAPAASTAVGHIGGFGGFRSAVWSAPEGGITVALGVNQASTDPNILATRVFNTILTHQGR